MELFKQYGAVGILAVMMMGVLNFLGSLVFENAQAVATFREGRRSDRAILLEMREDLKWLRRHSIIKKK